MRGFTRRTGRVIRPGDGVTGMCDFGLRVSVRIVHSFWRLSELVALDEAAENDVAGAEL